MELAGAVDAGDGGGTFGEKNAIAAEFVGVVEADAGLADEPGDEGEFFVVAGGVAVFDFGLGDDEEDALALEVGVGEALVAQELDAADLEVLEIAAVVQVAHGIDFGIADADGYRVFSEGHSYP